MSWAGAVGGLASAYGAHKANKQNIALAREQMRFQERMSNTAHQREVKDLKAAGLNPVLSATAGGASSPQGSLPQVKNVAENASSSAINFMQGLKQIEKMDAEIANTQADTAIKTPKATITGEAGNVIKQGIEALKGSSDNFSAKSINKNIVLPSQRVFEKHVRPQMNSAKKEFKNLKRKVVKEYNQYKSKFMKMFGN